MTRKRLPPAQQGAPDGLCGFYALINYIHNLEMFREDDESQTNCEAFRYLAEATEQLGLLTAHHIYDGFEWPKLLSIFNKMTTDWRLGVKAVPLAAVSDSLGTTDIVKLVRKVTLEGGEVVAHLSNGHWVLVYATDRNGLLIDDSELTESDRKPCRISNQEARHRFDQARVGLALVPSHSSLAEIV